MAKRGSKTRTLLNSRQGPTGSIRHKTFKPPCALSDEGKVEYDRLIDILESVGILERVDLACVANAARVKALLDRAHKDVEDNLDPKKVQLLSMLTSQHRGLLRELGLTSQPSKVVFRATPATPEASDEKWSGKLKIG